MQDYNPHRLYVQGVAVGNEDGNGTRTAHLGLYAYNDEWDDGPLLYTFYDETVDSREKYAWARIIADMVDDGIEADRERYDRDGFPVKAVS